MKLVLFDIDGTLLTTGFAGSDAMKQAFADLFAIADGLAGIVVSGNTDRSILQEALAKYQLAVDATTLQAFHECYIHHLRRTLQEPHRPRRLMPGIPQLLTALAARSDVILGLLTGNFATAARLKLEAFGIWHYFRVGAYGSDAADRNALVPIVRQRTRILLGQEVPPQRIFVIGDTPRDIACARAHGARAVAVATGSYRITELLCHRPDYCFADFRDVQAVLRVLTVADSGASLSPR